MKKYILGIIFNLFLLSLSHGGTVINDNIPVSGSSLIAAEVRNNFVAIKDLTTGKINSAQYTSINDALTACVNTTLVVGESIVLPNNLNIPTGCFIEMTGSGNFTKASTFLVTFVVGSGFSCPDNHQCFVGFTVGDVTGLTLATPEMFTENTVPGTTDMKTAIYSATSASKHVVFGNTTYGIGSIGALGVWASENDIILEFNNTILDYENSVVFTGTSWVMFSFTNTERVHIRGMVKIVGNLTQSDIKDTATYQGPQAFYFVDKAKDIKIDTVVASGIGLPVEFWATPNLGVDEIAYIGNGGTGYTVNDVLTLVGGTGTAATLTVASVNAGVITGLSVTTAGSYTDSVIPDVAGAVAGIGVTGGTGGNDALINVRWKKLEDAGENIVIDNIYCDNCYYGLETVYSSNVTVHNLTTEFTYRTFINISSDNVKANITMKDHVHDAVTLNGYTPIKNIDMNIRQLPPEYASINSNGSLVRFGTSTHGSRTENIKLNLMVDWGTVTGRGGSVVEFDPGDALGRGRIKRDLIITGTINGKGDLDSGMGGNVLIGTNLSSIPTVNDYYDNWVIGPLKIIGGGSIVIEPDPFENVITFNNVVSDGSVVFNDVAQTGNFEANVAHVEAINSVFTNQYINDGSYNPSFGFIDSAANLDIRVGWSGYTIGTQTGTGGESGRNLPPATVGLRYKFINGTTTASSIIGIDPNGTENIRGLAAGAKLYLFILGQTVELECVKTGEWEIVSGTSPVGDVRIGNGTPTQAQTGEDLYVNGKGEFDLPIYADGGVIGALTGNADTCTTASTLTIVNRVTAATNYLPFVSSLTGNLSLYTSATYNPELDPSNGNVTIKGNLTVNGNTYIPTLEVGQLVKGVQAGITAYAGGGQANAVLITKDVAEITVIGTVLDSVKLPVISIVGMQIQVMNHAAVNTAAVFPNTGAYIDALAINTAKPLSTNTQLMCTAYDSTHWECATLIR